MAAGIVTHPYNIGWIVSEVRLGRSQSVLRPTEKILDFKMYHYQNLR